MRPEDTEQGDYVPCDWAGMANLTCQCLQCHLHLHCLPLWHGNVGSTYKCDP